MAKFINFICNNQHFALSIDRVEKILLFQQPALIPDTSDYIAGFHSYNQEPLALIDMKRRLFKEKTRPDEQTKIIVVHWQGSKLGLIVEQITNVKEFQSEHGEKAAVENEKTRYLVETFHEDDVIILHIDIEKLFSLEGEKELSALIEK